MIPDRIFEHLLQYHPGFRHRPHPRCISAEELARLTGVSGWAVAKPVVVSLGDRLVLAVVAAPERLDAAALERESGAPVRLLREPDFAGRFRGCELGATPPLALYGAPIFADAKLLLLPRLLLRAGTHEDAVLLRPGDWMRCDGVRAVERLGRLPPPGRLVPGWREAWRERGQVPGAELAGGP